MKRLGVVALLALTSCGSCALPRRATIPITWRPDTRAIGALQIDTAIVHASVDLFRASFPNEAALCFDGAVSDTVVDGEAWLVVRLTSVQRARQDSADQFHVYFGHQPPWSGCQDPVIAIAHDHPYTPPDVPCTHSHPDVGVLFQDSRALLSLVFCGDGRLEALFQDGRRVPLRWVP